MSSLVPFGGDMGLTGTLSLIGPGGASGTLSTAGASKPNVEEHVMDPQLASQIFKFYYEEEPLIGVCKDQRFALAFVGEMHVEWGGGDIDPIRLDSPAERDQLDTLFKRALEYRDMFGMVPVKLSKTSAARKRNNKPVVVIPPFGSGNFVMQYDTVKMAMTVVYRVGAERTLKKRSSGQKSRQSTVKTYEVFVWPGYEPSRATKRFRSRVSSLLGRYLDITELRMNLRDADFRSAHPVVFTQARPDTRSLQEMTEEELLGLTDDADPGPEQSRRYQRDMHRAIQTEELAAAINQSAREPFGASGSVQGAPIARGTVDPSTRRAVVGERARVWDGAMQPLPIGEEMARGVQAQSRTDLIAFESRYEDLVCKTMGIPAAYISGAVGSQRMRGEADQLRNNVRASVLQDRADLNLFYAWAYEKTHRTADDDMMVRALLAADEKERADPSPDERRRVSKIRANIAKISAMPHRTRVVFSEDPLPKKVEIPMLQAAVVAGALTKLELVNLLRAEIGVPSIDERHELLRESDANKVADAETAVAVVAATDPAAAPRQAQKPQEPHREGSTSESPRDKQTKAGKRKKPDGEKEKEKEKNKDKDKDKDKGDDARPTKRKRGEKNTE